jgi:DNA-binding NarL/FixJ family response regulator
LVEDHPLFAAALQSLIDPIEDLEWLGCCEGVESLLAAHPAVDVVILDLRLGDGSTPYDNVKRLEDFGAKVLVYTNGEHPELLRSAAQAGVTGVVLKTESGAAVVDAVRCVAAGEPVVNTHWAAAIDGDPDLDAVRLPPRLQRVLTRYGDGESVPTIARQLRLSQNTVKGYLKDIRLAYAMAGRPIRSKTDFSTRAREDGWLPFPVRRRRRR